MVSATSTWSLKLKVGDNRPTERVLPLRTNGVHMGDEGRAQSEAVERGDFRKIERFRSVYRAFHFGEHRAYLP